MIDTRAVQGSTKQRAPGAQDKPPRDEDLMDVDEVADMLGVSPRTLKQWRHAGSGPVFVKVGRKPKYERKDVAAWIAERKGKSNDDFQPYRPTVARRR